jgi:ABC-type antimicrobial peptide transport system permease subunit
MLRPRWRKVIRDLWGNKIRTILVVLSIAIGVFSIGMIVSTQILLEEDLAVSYAATNPASIILSTDLFDAELLDTVRRLDAVRDVEARRSLTIPLQIAPDEWKSMSVVVLPDFREMRIHLINPVEGAWPPPRRSLVVERASLPYIGAELGDSVTVETAEINFARPHRIAEIERKALTVPGVAEVQSWIAASARRLRPDGQESESFALLGTNPQTSFIQPILMEGRWLLPQDENSVVLNSLVLKEEPDIQVGDWIDVTMEERESRWQVVGIVQAVLTGGIGYVNQPYLARTLNFVGRSGWLLIIADRHDGAFQQDLARRLKDHFDAVGMQVSATSTAAEIRELIEYQFNIIVVLLAVMAIMIAVVGGLGLTGTMSINVLERTREIGVMRAVGASDGSVLRIVLVEGLVVGLLSWFLGGLAAYPMGLLLSNIVGVSLLQSPLNYRFAIVGASGWLLAVLAIAALASLLPAWNASRLSVRQTLAYE